MKLTNQAQKTYYKIQLKSREAKNSRFQSLKLISKLLQEINVDFKLDEWSETKWRDNGLRYHTSGGGDYKGYRLQVPEIRLTMITTDSYYSCNTWQYARELEKLIKSKK